jgi:predicted DNA-binding transcriptional regulator AlpA
MPGEPAILSLTTQETPASSATPAAMESVCEEPALINGAAFAGLLDVNERTLLRFEQRGLIGPRPVRLGRLKKYRRSECLAWIACGCPKQDDWHWTMES